MKEPDDLPPLLAWLAAGIPARDRQAVVGDLLETARERRWGRARTAVELAAVAAGFLAGRLAGRIGPAASGPEGIRSMGGKQTMTISAWMHDMRLAARGLLRRPGLALTLAGTLALGIGANTAIFSLLRSAVWWDLPYEDPGRVLLHSDAPRGGSTASGWSQSLPNILDLRARVGLLQGMEAWTGHGGNLSGGDRPERVSGLAVGPDFLDVLGVEPALGRDFVDADNRAEAPRTVILAHGLWERAFGADPAVVGRTVEIDAEPHTVLGVLPELFEFRPDPEYLVAMRYDGDPAWERGRHWLYSVSRMREGAGIEEVREHASAVYRDLEARWPESNENRLAAVQPIREFLVPGAARSTLTLALAAVALVLALAALNVANLLLVRSEARRRELAVRVALGAGRARLLPTFLGEGLLVAACGGVLGVLLARLALPGLVAVYGSDLPRAAEVGLDGRVLLATLGVALLVGVVVGLVPALRHGRGDPADALREGTRAVSAAGRRIRTGMVVAETALATLLVASAALLVRSYVALADVETGLERPDRVLVAHVNLSGGRYPDRASRVRFFDELLPALGALPGVESAGMTSRLPLNGGTNMNEARVVGAPERTVGPVEVRWTSPGFFDAAGLTVVAGRAPRPADALEGRDVVVTEALARGLFGNPSDVLGERLVTYEGQEPVTVVGVVSDLRDVGPRRDPPAGIYYPYGPGTASGGYGVLLLRTSGDPLALLPAVRQAVARVDPTLPLHRTERLSDVARRATASERSSMAFFGLFALLALGLGAVGIYGVMAHTVTERTREVGLRMALGARRAEVVGMVVRGGAGRAAAGVALGLVAALLTGRWLESRLYGVAPDDPLTHALVAGVLATVAVLACWIPARRAAAVDPVEALRHD